MVESEPSESRVDGIVREWSDDLGWGVIDSDLTPGGCWCHFSVIEMDGFHRLSAGQAVLFTYSEPGEHGLAYQATLVTLPGAARRQPALDVDDPQAACSNLVIQWD